MNTFIASYYLSVFHSVGKLTGLTDEKELKTLTEAVLGELDQRKAEWETESRKGVFIYRIVLHYVFAYLEKRGEEKKIEFLRKIILIHPSQYVQLPENK